MPKLVQSSAGMFCGDMPARPTMSTWCPRRLGMPPKNQRTSKAAIAATRPAIVYSVASAAGG